MIGKNVPLAEQIQILHAILKQNEALYRVIEKSEELNLPEYYIGAGCIAQTVWNHQNGNLPMFGVNDIDFVYFDADISEGAENAAIQTISGRFADCPISLDIKNQARVHLWYKSHFGYDIPPYGSAEAAINTWPTTATAVGVRLYKGILQVYAPFGLNDLFSQVVRPNKAQITREIYYKKVDKWQKKWPSLQIIPW